MLRKFFVTIVSDVIVLHGVGICNAINIETVMCISDIGMRAVRWTINAVITATMVMSPAGVLGPH